MRGPDTQDSVLWNREDGEEVTSRPRQAEEDPHPPTTLLEWGKIDSIRRKACCCFQDNFLIPVIVSATTGSLIFGINTSVLNTSVDYIAADFAWCSGEEDPLGYVGCSKAVWYKAVTNAGVFAGAAVGAVIAGKIAALGLRTTNLVAAMLTIMGVLGSVAANGFSSLIVSRIIVGVGVGISSMATPAYISEIAPPTKRGLFGTMHQLILVSGQLVGVFLGLAFSPMPRQDPVPDDFSLRTFDRVWWRIMLAFGALPALLALYVFGIIFKFQTPPYYAKKGQYEDAAELLRRIYGKDDVSEEIEFLKRENQAGTKVPLMQGLKKSGYLRALLVGIGVAVFQQITGINAFIASSNKMFGEAGLEGRTITWASISLNVVNVVTTFIPAFLLDRLGRRTLLIIGSIGMTLSVLPATIMFYVQWNQDEISTALTALSIAGACLFLFFFSMSAGPITWVYLFEIFPLDIKASASAVCVFFNWASSIIMVFGSGFLATSISYTIFTICSGVFIVFIVLFVRETKNRVIGDSPYCKLNTGT